MKKTIWLLAGITLSVLSHAQKKNSPAAFAATITADDLKRHLYTIASKEMEGRETPSPGLEKAADYIENHFRSLGLKPGNGDSYRQRYPLYKDSMISTGIAVNGAALELTKEFQPNLNIDYTAEMKFSEAVFVGYGIVDGDRDAYRDLDVAGRLVVMLDGSPNGYKPSVSGFASPANVFNKLSKAQQKGATAVLIIYGNYPRNNFNTSGNYKLYGYAEKLYPLTFTISESAAAKIMGADGIGLIQKMKTNELASKTYKADIDLSYAKTTKLGSASNVIAVLEGTDKKDEYVFITSHYDHIGKRDTIINYGADDDGSGTCSVLEIAEAYAKAKAAGKGPRRNIVFMTVSGEEKGLWGSEYYTNHPIFPLEKTSVDLNIDMVGRIGSEYLKHKDSANYVYVIGDDKLSTDLTPITEQVNAKFSKIKLDRKYNDPNDPNRFYFRSDHYNFAEKGVPVIFYFNGTHADYHRPTDTPDKINYKLMSKRAQFVFMTAWEMANRDEMLKRDLKLERPKGF